MAMYTMYIEQQRQLEEAEKRWKEEQTRQALVAKAEREQTATMQVGQTNKEVCT